MVWGDFLSNTVRRCCLKSHTRLVHTLPAGLSGHHTANPPDLLFLVAAPFRLFSVKFLFDHHDLMPELYVEKFKRRGFGYKMMRWLEWLMFRLAGAVISTNDSYRQVAVARGDKQPAQVFVVRSGPDVSRLKPTDPDPDVRARARFVVGYVGIMGSQDGGMICCISSAFMFRHRSACAGCTTD